jgi:hypothetical protein
VVTRRARTRPASMVCVRGVGDVTRAMRRSGSGGRARFAPRVLCAGGWRTHEEGDGRTPLLWGRSQAAKRGGRLCERVGSLFFFFALLPPSIPPTPPSPPPPLAPHVDQAEARSRASGSAVGAGAGEREGGEEERERFGGGWPARPTLRPTSPLLVPPFPPLPPRRPRSARKRQRATLTLPRRR